MTQTALEAFMAAPVAHIHIDGIPMAYRRFGEGPPLLMVHGWPLSGVTYRYLLPELSQHFSCIVPDLPGAGDTPWHPGVGEVAAGYTRMLAGLADGLKLDRYALLAHDSGGAVARMLAARHGARITALVLTNTEVPDHVSLPVQLMQWATHVPGSRALFGALLGSSTFRQSGVGFGGCFTDRERIEGGFLETLAQDVTGAVQVLKHFDLKGAHRLGEVHARISAPTTLIWGEDDPFFPVQGAERMVPQFGGPTTLHRVPKMKLFVHEEAPQEVLRHALPALRAGFDAAPVRAA